MCKKKGLIIKGIGGFYYVETGQGEIIECKAKGLFKKEKIKPTVGDQVEIEEGENNHFTIINIEKRKNIFIRPPVSNIDTMTVVVSEREPKVNLETLDKLLIMAEKNGITPVICLNKNDLIKGESQIERIYRGVYKVFKVSAVNNTGIDQLKKALPKGKMVLAGSSGVGKSTILNKLLNREEAEIGNVSEKTKRGKHTTRHVEIFKIDESKYVFDTPGFSSLELQNIQKENLQELFPEIEREKGRCKYKDCKHLMEPGCQVIEKVQEEKISKSRYENYKKIYKELEREERQQG